MTDKCFFCESPAAGIVFAIDEPTPICEKCAEENDVREDDWVEVYDD